MVRWTPSTWFTYLIGVSSFIVMYVTFMYAYFNNMRVNVLINVLGEAHLELVILSLCAIIIIGDIAVRIHQNNPNQVHEKCVLYY